MVGTILLIGGIALLALLGAEYGLYRRARKREQEGMFDHGLPFIAAHRPGDDVAAADRAPEHHAHGPMNHPGD